MKICPPVAFLAAAVLLFVSSVAEAQVSREEFEELKSEVGALREGLKAQTDLLRQLLERMGAGREGRGAPFKETPVAVDDGAVYGRSDAKVTIVEFSDYQCPFCARYSRDTFPQIEREYIQTGRVRYVFRDYPIESSHPQAFKAHEAVHCASDQGKRLEMHKKVFASQRAIGVTELTGYAAELGMDRAKFERCLAQGTYAAKVRNGMRAGEKAGVRGTPTFFVGLTAPNSSEVKAVRRLVGAQPYSAFKTAIDELLASP